MARQISQNVTAGRTKVATVTPTMDTSQYASGDLLFDSTVISAMPRVNDMGFIINSVTVIDKDDQGAAFDIWLLDANVSFGSVNSAPSISDANAANIIGRIQIGTGDYYDLGGCRAACISNLAIPCHSVTNTLNIYVAGVNGTGTPTYTAAGLVIRFGVLQD